MNREQPEIYTSSEKASAENIKNSPNEEVREDVLTKLKQLFMSLRLKEAKKAYDKLEKQVKDNPESMGEPEIKMIDELRNFISAEERRVRDQVSDIKKLFGDGSGNNRRLAREAAEEMLEQDASSLETNQRIELKKIVGEAVENLPSGPVSDKQAIEILKTGRRLSEVTVGVLGLRSENPVDITMRESLGSLRDRIEKKEAREKLGNIGQMFKEVDETKGERIDKSLARKAKDKISQLRASFSGFDSSRRKMIKDIEEILGNDIDKLYKDNKTVESRVKILRGVKAVDEALDELREQAIIDKISDGDTGRRTVRINVAGVDIKISMYGGRKQRLKKILPYITGEDGSRDAEIGYIRSAVGLDQNDASRVWDEARSWRSEVGDFHENLKRWHEKKFVETQKKIDEKNKEKFTGFTPNGEKRRGTGSDDWQAGVNEDTGEPIFKEGYERARQYAADIGSAEGKTVFDQFFNASRRFGENPNRARVNTEGMSSKDLMIMADSLIKKIMRTEESTRDPKNQMAVWQLYDILSSDKIPANFRDKWAVQLALYDVGTIMGSVNSYEDWARVASFLWKEGWSVLESEKESFFYDKNGKALDIGFKDIQTALQLGTHEGSGKEVWFGHIMQAKNLSELELRKRQFMGFMIAEQMGVKVRLKSDGTLSISSGQMNILDERLGAGAKGFFRMVGLSEDGSKVLSNTQPENNPFAVYDSAYDESKDVYNDYIWFVNNVITHSHMTLDSVEIERGGHKGKFWKYLPNILRKLHGNAAYHYFHQKQMGLNPSMKTMDVLDCRWRSQYSWRKDSGKGSFSRKFVENLEDGGIKKENIGTFFAWLESATMSSDNAYHDHGFSLTINEVRERAGDGMKSYEKVARRNAWMKNFDWRKILVQQMGIDEARLQNVDTKGASGAKFFLENYSHNVFNYDSINPSDIQDHIKYTGAAYEYFGKALAFINYPTMESLKALFDTYSGFHGSGLDATRKFHEVLTQFHNFSEDKLFGYETYKRSDGTEGSEATKEYDEDGNVVYRRGKSRWYVDAFNFSRKGGMSPAKRRGMKNKSWLEKREEVERGLRIGIYNPDTYKFFKRRTTAKLWFGLDWSAKENIIQTLIRQPHRIPLMPATILRGILVDFLMFESKDIEKHLGEFWKMLQEQTKDISKY